MYNQDQGKPRVRSNRRRYSPWTCYHCHKRGHKVNYCYKLYGKGQSKYSNVKKEWVRKEQVVSNVVFTSLKSSVCEGWYLDSGCSRHMTGNKSFLTKLEGTNGQFVTFGGGAKGKIIGKGSLQVDGLPELTEVLLVDGLTVNLISISQLCDDGFSVSFGKDACEVKRDSCMIMKGVRSSDNCYIWSTISAMTTRVEEEADVWHKRLGHTNYRNLQQLMAKEAVRGLPRLSIKDKTCGECIVGKQTRVPHHMLQQLVTTRVLELLHMDLMGPMQVESIGGKRYVYVCVDDFSRYTWVEFLREKSDTFEVFQKLATQLQREKGIPIVRIRSDHGKEFENAKFQAFCTQEGIKHEFSAPITPQQNEIVERKNRTIQEMAKVMLHAKKVPTKFWAEAVNTTCHIHNRITLSPQTRYKHYHI